MELLETQDPERRKLLETSDRHKKALEREVGDLTKSTDQMLRNAVIIGGSLALTYFLITTISKTRKKKKKKKDLLTVPASEGAGAAQVEEEEDDDSGFLGVLGTRILTQATLLLLDMAKVKLAEYLESRKQSNEDSGKA